MQYLPRYGARQKMKDPSRSDIDHAIEEYIVGLHAERNRAILRRRLIDGICFEPLAEEFDLSVRQVKNIVKKYKPIVFKHL